MSKEIREQAIAEAISQYDYYGYKKLAEIIDKDIVVPAMETYHAEQSSRDIKNIRKFVFKVLIDIQKKNQANLLEETKKIDTLLTLIDDYSHEDVDAFLKERE